MSSLFRDTAAGSLLRFVSGNRLLRYPEERHDFVLPATFSNGTGLPRTASSDSSATRVGDVEAQAQDALGEKALDEKTHPEADGTLIVGWYSDSDPANPQNWSSLKKAWVTFIICLLTFSVYVGASLITSGFPSLIEEFGVSQQTVLTTLSMYVLAYGSGAMFFSPLSEVPAFGRNPFYWAPMIGFVAFQAGAATTPTFAGLVLLRLLTAFCGAPVLSTGGASLADIYEPMFLPTAFAIWVLPAFNAPAVGPVLGNFAAEKLGWRITMWELFAIIGLSTVIVFFGLPETSHANILYRRAQRLRRLTGNENLKSQAEIDQGKKQMGAVFQEALLRPFQITILDPAVAFSNAYVALVYATYYTFFDSFDIVYGEIYKFSFGGQGLAYLSISVGGIIGFLIYWAYQHFYMPKVYKAVGWPVNEQRLEPALISTIFASIGLFIFAGTAQTSVHWIGSMIGTGIFVAANFVTLQCIFFYIILSYPAFGASILASNDLIRSLTATFMIHAGVPMFRNLGIPGGSSLLGGLSVLGIGGAWLIYHYGARLRAASRFAVGDSQQ